ncbi:12170_t:CDS:1, partial [Funneliformis mosseae]
SRFFLLDKEKEEETLTSEIILIITSDQTVININNANDTSENFLNNKKSP